MIIFSQPNSPSFAVRRILLIRRKALGDCLVTLPAVRALASAFPEAEISLIIDKPFARLVSLLVPEVEIISWSAGSAEYGSGLKWYRWLWSKKFDLVVDWLGNPRTALWTAATGAPLRVGYDLARRRLAYNVVVPRNRHSKTGLRGFAGEAFIDPLRALGLRPVPWNPGQKESQPFSPPESDLSSDYVRWRDERLLAGGRNIALMMSATWPAKAWPTRHVVDLVKELLALGEDPLFIPGPGDQDIENDLRLELPASVFAPNTNLIELADLLSHCIAFAGTDCGGRHVAAAMGLPTVTLFGPTDPEGWNPNSPQHVSISLDLDCLGCDHSICPLADRPCLEQLPASAVVTGLQRVLNTSEGKKQ